MQQKEIIYRWMAPIHRFEKKFFGGLLSATSFLVVGIVGIAAFAAISQLTRTGLAGIAIAIVATIVSMLLTLLVITPLPIFYDMTLPVYVWRRFQVNRNEALIRPTLLLLRRTGDSHTVAILDEHDDVIGEIESHLNGYHP